MFTTFWLEELQGGALARPAHTWEDNIETDLT
jgi:hypothetical protein